MENLHIDPCLIGKCMKRIRLRSKSAKRLTEKQTTKLSLALVHLDANLRKNVNPIENTKAELLMGLHGNEQRAPELQPVPELQPERELQPEVELKKLPKVEQFTKQQFQNIRAVDSDDDTGPLISSLLLKTYNTSHSWIEDEETANTMGLLTQTVNEKYNHLETWLKSPDFSCVLPMKLMHLNSDQEDNELLSRGTMSMNLNSDHKDNEFESRGTNTNWNIDSDEDDQLVIPIGVNPFALKPADEQHEKEHEEQDSVDEEQLGADCKMNNFIQRIQSRDAIPEFALSDAVFSVDKPKEAMAIGAELPLMSMSDKYAVGDVIKLFVIEVYSPFQFWFQEETNINLLNSMSIQLSNFYSSLYNSNWQLPTFFLRAGYICAVKHEYMWKRARIVKKPAADATIAAIYFLDYGGGANVPFKDIFFLSRSFSDYPALAMHGTLSDVYPLDLHWPIEATNEFIRMVRERELHALIKDIDTEERILFVSLSVNSSFKPTISTLMINAQLAGQSHHYSQKSRDANCGRRLRYVRERLPTFEMIETQVFPTTLDFEETFDDIVYMPSFYRNFEPPKLGNPFRLDLEEALANWLIKFEPQELAWRKMCREAHIKKKQAQENRRRQFLEQNPKYLD